MPSPAPSNPACLRLVFLLALGAVIASTMHYYYSLVYTVYTRTLQPTEQLITQHDLNLKENRSEELLEKVFSAASAFPISIRSINDVSECQPKKSKTRKRTKSPAESSMAQLLSDGAVIKRAKNCTEYFGPGGIMAYTMADDLEAASSFPLAFSHTVHTDVAVLEAMLALTFRPSDAHCIHVDTKAKAQVKEAVEALVSCYSSSFPTSTIFVASDPISVKWGAASVLKADVICLEQLMKRQHSWQMYLNLAGTELPLKPIGNIRHVLRTKNTDLAYLSKYNANRQRKKIQRSGGVPFGLRILKGVKAVALTRSTCDFLVNHPVAREYYDWLLDTPFADEHFYATLLTVNASLISAEADPSKAASYLVTQKTDEQIFKKGSILWTTSPKTCSGIMSHAICKIGLDELDVVQNKNCIFANKFTVEASAAAISCHVKHLLGVADM